MRVTIHQPEHFPYEGFFKKMENSDIFVILDDVKFKKNNFQNRNKIINTAGKDEWFGFPVPKKSNSLLIKEVCVCREEQLPWRQKLIKKLKHNLNKDMTSFYEHETLIDINMSGIEWIMKEMNIKTKLVKSSEIETTGSKSELLLSICKEMGATTYVSGAGGKDYLDEKIFIENNIQVEFFQAPVKNYYSMLYNLTR